MDHYKNLTHKHIMGLKWVTNFCASVQIVVKLDDDIFVHVSKLAEFLDQKYASIFQTSAISETRNAKPPGGSFNDGTIYCSAYQNQGPRRDQSDKWYVSRDEYPADRYPSWCEGFAYVTTPDVARKLYDASLSTTYFWIDDVYVTGILAEKIKVKREQFRSPFGYNALLKSRPPFDEAMFLVQRHERKFTKWMHVWNVTSRRYQGNNPRKASQARSILLN